MMSLIQTHQQLFILGILLFSLVILLWGLQYWIIQHGKQLLDQFVQYGETFKQHVGKSNLFIRIKYKYPAFFRFFVEKIPTSAFLWLTSDAFIFSYGLYFSFVYRTC